jgi:endonuclease YncB( thermonuclease family)
MFQYRAALARVIDGDSAMMLIDVGFSARVEVEVRLLDVHAPERSQPGGAEATSFAAAWFGHVATIDPGRRWPLYVETVQTRVVEPTERQSFTRYVATVWPVGNRAAEASLNWLLAQYLAGHPEWPSGM